MENYLIPMFDSANEWIQNVSIYEILSSNVSLQPCIVENVLVEQWDPY